jgi:membrane-anchored protein YejM (alkaline phosphatase superfamily)
MCLLLAQFPHWMLLLLLALTEWDTKSMRHAYYAAVSWMDHNVGTVLDGLDSLGLNDDTIVLLHGDRAWQQLVLECTEERYDSLLLVR